MFNVNEVYKNYYGIQHRILGIYENYMIAECLDDLYTIEIYTLSGCFVGSVESFNLNSLKEYIKDAEEYGRITLKLLDNS